MFVNTNLHIFSLTYRGRIFYSFLKIQDALFVICTTITDAVARNAILKSQAPSSVQYKEKWKYKEAQVRELSLNKQTNKLQYFKTLRVLMVE